MKPIHHQQPTMILNGNRGLSFRRYFSQALACFANGLTLLNIALVLNLPTIIIAALSSLSPANNPNENLRITPDEVSWIASSFTIFVVIGCVMTNFLDPLGRKKSLILGNIPYFFCWLSFYYSTSVLSICITLAVMGFISGILEAPIILYISELSEPSIRTILLVTTNFTLEIGAALIYFLGNQMPWRDVTLFCAAVPIVAILFIIIVPETPHWLLSHDRPAEALESLKWLRGWVNSNDVQIEFENLQRYKAVAYVCYECEKQGTKCNHPQPTLLERFREFGRRKTLIPFFVIACLYSNALFGGAVFRPFLVPTLKAFKSPIDPNTVLVWVGYAGLAANILSMFIIRMFGRRITHLISLAAALIIIYALGVCGFLQSNHYDFGSALDYFPVNGFIFLLFLQNLGLRCVPNLLLSEIFSYRSKSLASGIATAVFYIGLSVTAKTFHLLQAAITLPGQCVFYATIGVVGLMIIYLVLPETEGRTLEDIEMYFSNKKRKFNDIRIPKVVDQEKSTNQ